MVAASVCHQQADDPTGLMENPPGLRGWVRRLRVMRAALLEGGQGRLYEGCNAPGICDGCNAPGLWRWLRRPRAFGSTAAFVWAARAVYSRCMPASSMRERILDAVTCLPVQAHSVCMSASSTCTRNQAVIVCSALAGCAGVRVRACKLARPHCICVCLRTCMQAVRRVALHSAKRYAKKEACSTRGMQHTRHAAHEACSTRAVRCNLHAEQEDMQSKRRVTLFYYLDALQQACAPCFNIPVPPSHTLLHLPHSPTPSHTLPHPPLPVHMPAPTCECATLGRGNRSPVSSRPCLISISMDAGSSASVMTPAASTCVAGPHMGAADAAATRAHKTFRTVVSKGVSSLGGGDGACADSCVCTRCGFSSGIECVSAGKVGGRSCCGSALVGRWMEHTVGQELATTAAFKSGVQKTDAAA
eukprot:356112-Chlamydomonas_euryale.AAC.2